MNDSSTGRNPVEKLAEEFAACHRRGERPSVEEYVQRYPQWSAEIRELFPALLIMEQFKPGLNDHTGPFDANGTVGHSATPQRLGEFLIIREIGHGGMGVVYEAMQESLGRRVALKVLPGAGLAPATYLERFRREARAAAKLQHPNIVPVHGTFETGGVHYYAMQFIEGQGLDRVLHDIRALQGTTAQNSPVPPHSAAHTLLTGNLISIPAEPTAVLAMPLAQVPTTTAPLARPVRAVATYASLHRAAARIALQVAEALAYAHEEGILHRDIKPSNLLLDARGTVWVTDFGLAKAEGSGELTGTGDIIGTIRFMAPERFDGESLPQGDIYSLGLTLYELLTLRPAFDDPNRGRLIDKVLHDAPVPPRQIDGRIPRDLETIVLKCLAKEPLERYRKSAELADDLRRFLADEPIKARRSTWLEHTWRWCRRNPAVAGLSAAVFLLVVFVLFQQLRKPARPGQPGESAEEPLSDPGTLIGFRGMTGTSRYFRVKAERKGTVWGTDIYTDDSSLTDVVLHAGILREGETGVVKVTMLNGQGSYLGSVRNRVMSHPYGAWSGSFRVESASARASTPAQPRTASGPLPLGARVLEDPVDLSSFRNGAEKALYIRVTGQQTTQQTGGIWGTDVYTDDSTLGAAAVHAGILRHGEPGIVKVTLLPGQAEYKSSMRNGITSSSWDRFEGSFRMEGVKE